MTLYPEMFISKWHLLAVGLIIIAWIGLIIGKYDRRTLLRSGAGATLLLYIIVTIPIASITYDEINIENFMLDELDKNYSLSRAGGPSNPHILTAAIGAFPDGDTYDLRIYVGNYSPNTMFRGSVKLTLMDAANKVLKEYTYSDLVIEPGKKIRVEKSQLRDKVEHYNYNFYPE